MTTTHRMGWRRDLPDLRDFSVDDMDRWVPRHSLRAEAVRNVAKWFKNHSAVTQGAGGIEPFCDLSQWCSAIDDQGALGSCTAQAGIGLIEYYENRAHGRYLDASRLFLYKTTRNLMGEVGDTGAYLRTTMKAMALFGAPPEEIFPYDIQNFDDEPSAFAYSYGQAYQSISYFRLDQPGLSGPDVLSRVKHFLAAGYPSMFGFSVYGYGNEAGEFSFPDRGARLLGGHAVVAVGYDDQRQIGSGNSTTQGALKIRNSWGRNWGNQGYGWLPYEYVTRAMAVDFWSLFRQEYMDSKRFK